MYRKYRVPSIWREMDQLRHEMSHLFETAAGQHKHASASFPAINIWADENSQFISAEIPGVKAEDININATADTLTISGNRVRDEVSENARYHRRERGYGVFTRKIQLPFMIDTDSVNAQFNNGILIVELQRAESDKPKKIAVKSE